MATMALGSKGEAFKLEGQTWICKNALPSDVIINIGEISFHLHKNLEAVNVRYLVIIFVKEEVRCIQFGPGGLFFIGDAAGELKVWKWVVNEEIFDKREEAIQEKAKVDDGLIGIESSPIRGLITLTGMEAGPTVGGGGGGAKVKPNAKKLNYENLNLRKLKVVYKETVVTINNKGEEKRVALRAIYDNCTQKKQRHQRMRGSSQRRNDRMKRKQMEFEGDETVAQDPGIVVQLAKRRAAKKAWRLTKSVPANFSVSKESSMRSSVRSSKEIKKAIVAVVSSEKKHVVDLGRMTWTRSVRRI